MMVRIILIFLSVSTLGFAGSAQKKKVIETKQTIEAGFISPTLVSRPKALWS